MKVLNRRFFVPVAFALVGLAGIAAASSAVAAEWLYFEGDMVRGVPKGGPTGPVCVLASQFKHNERVVWRVRAFAPDSRHQLGKDKLKSVVIELSDGTKHKARYGVHPPTNSTDTYWTAAWDIPADYPTGSFAYTVVATDNSGKVHRWQPFNIKFSQFAIVAGEAMHKRR